MAPNRLQRGFGREALDERHARAGEQGRQERAVEAVRVGQRQHGEHHVVGRERHHRPRPRLVGERERLVREHRALRPPHAPRRVQNQRWMTGAGMESSETRRRHRGRGGASLAPRHIRFFEDDDRR